MSGALNRTSFENSLTAVASGDSLIEHGEILPHIDAIVRVRAVQDLSPGVALAFLFQLKDLLREEAERHGAGSAGGTADDLREIERQLGEQSSSDTEPAADREPPREAS